MKSYDGYKDSGIEWIGEIPKEWTRSKLKFHIDFSNGYAFHSDDYKLEGKKIVRMGNIGIDCRFKKNNFKYCSYILYKKLSNYHLKKEDLIISMTDITPDKNLIGKTAIIDENEEYILNQRVGRIRVISNELITKYLYYYTNSSAYTDGIKSIAYGSVQFNASVDDLIDYYMYLPTKQEQQKIASFLDKKTTAIDSIIEKKEKLIKKLEAYKKSVITEAVTKGKLGDKYINEDGELVDEIEMKESGIEWIGDIPSYWNTTKIKYIEEKEPFALVDGPFGSNLKTKHFIKNGEVFVIESNFATTGIINEDNLKTISEKHYHNIKRSEVKEGDIVIAKIGARYGRNSILAKLSKKSVVSGNSMKLTIDTNTYNNKFISLQLSALKHNGYLSNFVKQTAQPALSLGIINNIKISAPSKRLQSRIVDFIYRKNDKMNNIINKTQQSIKKYKAYKKSLIYEAVTGKIDLRDYNEGGNNNVNPNNS